MMNEFLAEEYLQELEKIVNIDSGSRIPGGTDKIADYFEKIYKGLGLSVKRTQPSPELGPCLEIRNRVDEEGIDVLLAGHMDTVFPEGTVKQRPFFREGNLAYGPGIMDMKAGLLLGYYLVKSMVESRVDISFCVAMNSDEEISSVSSQEWLKGLARKSTYAFILEPGRKNGEFVSERKGLARYVAKFQGIAAHAGVAPQDGASAVHEMGRWISALADLNNYEIGTSVNIGKVFGGTAANVVCDYADCQIDTRFCSIDESEKVKKVFDTLCNNPFDSRVLPTVSREGFRPPMTCTPMAAKLLKLLKDTGESMGIPVQWVKTGGGSDGNFIAFEGCTVVDGAGPSGEGAHSNKEFLHLDSIEPRLKLLYQTMLKLAAGKNL